MKTKNHSKGGDSGGMVYIIIDRGRRGSPTAIELDLNNLSKEQREAVLACFRAKIRAADEAEAIFNKRIGAWVIPLSDFLEAWARQVQQVLEELKRQGLI